MPLDTGKRKVRRKPLSELCVNGNFTEDRKTGKESCRGTVKKCTLTRRRREKYKKTDLKEHQQFTMEERHAEITLDLVLKARAKLSDNKVNGPEDAVVSEMISQLPLKKIKK